MAGLFELYKQLLPTRLYASQKMGKDPTGAVTCRLYASQKMGKDLTGAVTCRLQL